MSGALGSIWGVDSSGDGPESRVVGAQFPLPRTNERYQRTKYGDVLVRSLRVPWATFQSYIPIYDTPDELIPQCLFQGADVQRDELDGDFCDITLTYEQTPESGSSASTLPVPAPEWSEAASGVDVDIRQHPEWATGANLKQYWDFTLNRPSESAPAWFRGMTRYIGGAGQFNLTTYSRAKYPATFNLIGKRLDPDAVASGLNIGNDGKWLCIGATRGNRYAFYYRQLTFQFSATDWPTQVYAAASL